MSAGGELAVTDRAVSWSIVELDDYMDCSIILGQLGQCNDIMMHPYAFETM